MNKKGTVALEAIIASGLALMLLTVLCSLFLVFWQTWHETTVNNRQRQWAALAFEYLDRDIQEASKVSATASSIRVTIPKGTFEYRLSVDPDTGIVSYHRRLFSTYFAFAIVESADWWWEGELLWLQINFPTESYRCCYYIPEEKR